MWDLIVVGAGTAGIPCAIEAATKGGRVLLVEKSDDIGGTLHYSGGQMSAAGTRRQRQKGIQDSPERHLEDVLRISHGRAQADLARLAVELAPSTIDWLDELGFPFAADAPAIVYDHEIYSVPRTHWGDGFGLSVLETMRRPFEAHLQAGRIDLLLEHRLTGLVQRDGRVVGIEADGVSGATICEANAVVLTTGGYAADPILHAELTPAAPRLVSHARSTSTGDGIREALALGAQFRNGDVYLPSLGGFEVSSGRVGDWREGWAMLGSASLRAPREIYVAADGRRFINEDDTSNDRRERAVMDLPGQRFWVIFDEQALTAGESLVMFWDAATMRERASEGLFCWHADTLVELAERAGIVSKGLLETVACYNKAVETGKDAFGRAIPDYPIKTPPYYALATQGSSLVSWGGLTVDAELRVLHESGNPIPGLYAAGEILGMAACSGNAFVGGMSVTPALSFGRLLGQRLAGEREI